MSEDNILRIILCTPMAIAFIYMMYTIIKDTVNTTEYMKTKLAMIELILRNMRREQKMTIDDAMQEIYQEVIKNDNFKWDEILSSQYHYAGNDLYLFKGNQDNIYFIKADSPENAYKTWASNAIGLVGNMLIDALLED